MDSIGDKKVVEASRSSVLGFVIAHARTSTMTSFICSPISVASSNRLRGISGNPDGNSVSTRSRLANGRLPVLCRMRNRGGFHLPPRVPQDLPQRKRAMELLGNLTQRKNIKPTTRRETEALVGGFPNSRQVAQQWKVALQHTPNARVKHLGHPSAFKHRKLVLQRICLPEQNQIVGRCFVLLGVLERRYRLSQPPSTRVLEELEEKLGDYPVDVEEAHHFIKALIQLQKERRSRELRPQRIPLESMEELRYAKMLLGTFAVRGSVGRQADRLQELIGAMPRNTNVAASWKKIISAAIRKKERRDRTARRLAEIQQKRQERRLRRQQRELGRRLVLEVADSAEAPGITHNLEEVTSPSPSRPVTGVQEKKQGSASFVSRLQSMLFRFFGRRR